MYFGETENWVPKRLHLATPNDVCIYCGEKACDNEHLIPHSFLTSAERKRASVGITTRSCRSCNATLSNKMFPSLDQRVDFVKHHIINTLKSIPSANWTQGELYEMSPTLRGMVENQIASKLEYERKAAWTNTPAYIDLREKIYCKIAPRYAKNTPLLQFLRPFWMWSM